MRDAFVRALTDLASDNYRVLLLTGDLGFGVLDNFRERFPDQYYNLGVAEQNLAGVAAGLALSGHTVFTYSIANFPILRCLEQIRNDICYHKADVKIVAVGGGMSYGALGPSHFATEDLAIMRAIPDISVVAPGDPIEVEQLVPQIARQKGPCYLRLGRAGELTVHADTVEVTLGRPTLARKGELVLILTTGGMLPVAMDAACTLNQDNIEPQVVSIHTLQPFDADLLVEMVSNFSVVITCEEHTIIGGLGGAIAEVLLESGINIRFHRFGLKPGFPDGIGTQEYMRSVNDIDSANLVRLVKSLLDDCN